RGRAGLDLRGQAGRGRHRRRRGQPHQGSRAMIARMIAVAAALAASPALAASGPFFSLRNTDFIVTLAFLGFIGILLYFRIPAAIGKLLDKRAEGIKADIAEARRLRD